MFKHETAQSARERIDDESGTWEPEFTKERFAGILICNECRDPVAIAGNVTVERSFEGWDAVLVPQYVCPAPRLFSRPVKMPAAVRSLLVRAEEQFWSSSAGATNAIRAAIEAILTDLKIRRSRRTKKGKTERLTLHGRIQEYEQKNPQLAKKLMAVKWVGNAGSHDGEEPTRDDVYDCFDLMEHVIEEVYDGRSKRLETLALKITKEEGPLSRKGVKRR